MPNPLSAMKRPARNTSPTLQDVTIVGAVVTFSAINTLATQFLSTKMPTITQRVHKVAPANTAGTITEVGLLHDPVDPTVKVLKMNHQPLQHQL